MKTSSSAQEAIAKCEVNSSPSPKESRSDDADNHTSEHGPFKQLDVLSSPIRLRVPRISVCSSTLIKPPCNTVIAIDGKVCNRSRRWGVGIFDDELSVGHFSGGEFSSCPSLICDASMDQSVVETLALIFGLYWIRKRIKPNLQGFVANSFNIIHHNVAFVTDRTATIARMIRYSTDGYPSLESFPAAPFDIVLRSAATALLKLLLLRGTATFINKGSVAGHADQKALAWTPDRLAKRGLDEGNVRLDIPEGTPVFHLLSWREIRWEGSLLVCAEATLENAHAVVVEFGAPSYEHYIRYCCDRY